jgi:hypothetical protein
VCTVRCGTEEHVPWASQHIPTWGLQTFPSQLELKQTLFPGGPM